MKDNKKLMAECIAKLREMKRAKRNEKIDKIICFSLAALLLGVLILRHV